MEKTEKECAFQREMDQRGDVIFFRFVFIIRALLIKKRKKRQIKIVNESK